MPAVLAPGPRHTPLLARSVPVLLALAIGLGGATSATGQANLVVNSGFEPGTLCPGQWSGTCADGYTGTLNSDLAGLRVVSEEDNYVLEMTLPHVGTPPPHAAATWSGGPVSPQTYEVSVSTRARGLTGKARLTAFAEKRSGNTHTILASASTDLPRRYTTWTRVGLRLAAPSGTDRIRVELQGDGSCPTGSCGQISFDDLRVAPADASTFAVRPIENVCAEGDFLDVATTRCLPRVSNRGFSESDFTAALAGRPIRQVGACTESALRSALEQAESSGGGIVRIPACDIELTRAISIPGSTLIEGAGSGNTVLRPVANTCFGSLLTVSKKRHSAVRDLTLDGAGCIDEPMAILYSDNIKVERVEFDRARRNGLIFSYSRRVTLRYNTAHGSSLNNGLSSKDCYLQGSETQVSTALCEARIRHSAGPGEIVAPGSIWTEDYAVYSNHLFDNPNDHGLALHATVGEVAGNLMENNLRGAKLPDARYVKVHHNRMRRNELWGIHVYSPIVDRPPQNFVFAHNEFSLNGEFAVRLEGARDVYLADNTYDRNFDVYHRGNPWGFDFPQGANVLRISARQFENAIAVMPETFTCASGQDASLETSGVAPVVLEGSPCSTYLDNLPPIAQPDTASTAPGVRITLNPLSNDRDGDGDGLRFAGLTSGPFNGSATSEGVTMTYTPSASFIGTEVMLYRLEDTKGGFTIGEIRVAVAAPNRSPVAADDQATTFQGTLVAIPVLQNDTDPDGDEIRLTRIVTSPRNGSALIDGPRILYTPAAGFLGADSFTYEITDGRGGIGSAAVFVAVSTQPNRNPVAQNDTVTTSIDSPVLVDVLSNDTDPDGDILLFARFVTAPARGTVTFVDGKVRYLPFAGALGSDTFSYETADGEGGSAVAQVLVTITTNPNTAPVAIDDTVATTSGAETLVTVLNNDIDDDGDRLFITRIVQHPMSGSAVVRSNAILYTSEPTYLGADSLVYAVSDGRGGESMAVVRFYVSAPVNGEFDAVPLAVGVLETFPNPASGVLHVRFSTLRPASVRLVLFDLLGRAVIASPLGVTPAGEYTHMLNVTDLPGGIYAVTLEMENRRQTRLVSITR